ncbi:MAG: hypothetical protein AAGJ10_16460 [Bacteroidota bacterium]
MCWPTSTGKRDLLVVVAVRVESIGYSLAYAGPMTGELAVARLDSGSAAADGFSTSTNHLVVLITPFIVVPILVILFLFVVVPFVVVVPVLVIFLLFVVVPFVIVVPILVILRHGVMRRAIEGGEINESAVFPDVYTLAGAGFI